MIARINFGVLIVSGLLAWFFYVRSVSPAALEREIGPRAYELCGRYRAVSVALMFVIVACYVVYGFYPLALPLPERFPWPYWVSALLALLLAVPSLALVVVGMRHAGPEAIAPRKEHGLYGGIYRHIRHPQILGEIFLWWALAFLVHSPFLALFSFVWAPVWVHMAAAEDRDLALRFGEQFEGYRRRTGAFFPRRARREGK